MTSSRHVSLPWRHRLERSHPPIPNRRQPGPQSRQTAVDGFSPPPFGGGVSIFSSFHPDDTSRSSVYPEFEDLGHSKELIA
jgi:hypothetical protein